MKEFLIGLTQARIYETCVVSDEEKARILRELWKLRMQVQPEWGQAIGMGGCEPDAH